MRLLLPWLIVLVWLAGPVWGQDLVGESIPGVWLDQLVPEKLPAQKYPAYYNDLDKAQAQVFSGRYKTALLTLATVKKGDAAQMAQVKAAALAAVGRRDEALAVLSAAEVADRPRIQVERARVLADLGRLDEAVSLLKSHLEKHPDSLAGHYYLGAICETAGDLEAARAAYEWINKTYYNQWQGRGAADFEDAEQVTLMGRGFDRYAALTGAYARNEQLHNQILKVFIQAYDVIDREYWPAHVAAAEYFLSHSNPREAAEELEAALAGNPNDARTRQLLGLIALEMWNFDAADRHIAAMRSVDRSSVEAELLDCRNLLQQRRPREAELPARRVLERQPRRIEALGLLASACALQLKEDQVQALLEQVDKLDADNATAYLDLAEQLSAMRQYPRAEATYEKAIERAPWWTAPRNGLGLLLTQSGDEEKAKIVLDAAYALDPFNFRTTNYLILLDKMAKMARNESGHFVVIYDKGEDPFIAEYFTDYLEGIHAQVAGDFKHEPSRKTLIEIFPTHDAFSVRTTGSPWIGTVGASTGRVIALVAPRQGPRTMGTFNWAQVLRHEYTHTVTLSATENRIGHWMTEGLAVWEEHSPLRWEWVPMLYNAVKKKQLFSMEDLTWAFVRPRRPSDRQLAYAQSYWICQYIEEKWGHETILAMMDAFKAGQTEPQVFQNILKLSPEAFGREFFAWAEKQVAGWGYDEATTKKYDELVKQAEQMTENRQDEEALKLWLEIVKLRPMDQLPHQRLAALYRSKAVNQPGQAVEHLLRLHQVSLKDNRFAKALARTYLTDLNEVKKAERYALEAVYVDPYDPDAHELLAGVYEKNGNGQGLEREKRVLAALAKREGAAGN
jgi:tetratricopeptide (TPR) repeat protein